MNCNNQVIDCVRRTADGIQNKYWKYIFNVLLVKKLIFEYWCLDDNRMLPQLADPKIIDVTSAGVWKSSQFVSYERLRQLEKIENHCLYKRLNTEHINGSFIFINPQIVKER